MFSQALVGNYVNFGVFELYGGRALADALGIALKMTLSVPLVDILAYRRGSSLWTSGPSNSVCLAAVAAILKLLRLQHAKTQ
nr:DNA-directed DNA polymerase [Tanacetum cinerariifolium]